MAQFALLMYSSLQDNGRAEEAFTVVNVGNRVPRGGRR